MDTRRSKWFCLASLQHGTIISTSANMSGSTRHLHVFHDFLSPKIVQMKCKVEGREAVSGFNEQQDMKQMVRWKLSKARPPLLHLSLGPAFAIEGPLQPLTTALAASFVSSAFDLKRMQIAYHGRLFGELRRSDTLTRNNSCCSCLP